MAGTTTLIGVPYLSFPSDTPIAEQLQALEQALIDHPEDELHIIRFIVCFASLIKEKHQLCLETTDRLLELAEDDEDRMDALIKKAGVLIEDRTDMDLAEKFLMDANTIDCSYQQPYEMLCEIYMARKEYAKALYWADLTLKQPWFQNLGFRLKGEALLELKRVDDAITAFQAAIEVKATSSEAHFGLGKSHLEKKQYKPALDAFMAAFDNCYDPEEAHAYAIGFCYQYLDDPYRAMKWYCKALDIDPTSANALNNLAVLHHDLNNGWNEAIPYLLKAVELSNEAITPSMKAVYFNLWLYHKEILNPKLAAYYRRLMYRCAEVDETIIDLLSMLDEEEDYDDDEY